MSSIRHGSWPEIEQPDPAATHGCESCHGPGEAHVDAGGDPTKLVKLNATTPQESRRMVRFIVGTVVSVGLAGSAAAQDATVAKGMQVYADQKCLVCHAIAGKGNAKGPLDDVGSKLKVDDIRAWMVNPAEMTQKTKADRKPAMRAYPNLSKDDLDALVAYMVSLKKK